ncbi:LysR family transcriptional regulator [Exilibacterium tricleocarpae]|uniref:LysR family transcriptional regulator n=1 Tax=Exilibacterium tricleocarpae TaxID=2591008 RepID=A0A545SPR2_9GAMM|nr:LysR family transcriptional regulator [Exilibacterium tricleocarpae]TQV66972.1 LysR family transcriptional regulator [Exilibacterium tricleocarpae]
MINPVFLRTFMDLVETNHFTRTAERLNMTQPGVSQHIKKLEAQLGKPLLNRHGKTFDLTTAGESLYQYGLRQSAAETELRNSIAEDDRHSGPCRLACSGSMAMQLYPQLLGLQKQFPGITVQVEAAPNSTIIERVRTNRSDMGIVTQPVRDPTLLEERLGEDPLCLALPAQADSAWESLLHLGFINHPDGHHYAIQLLEANFPETFLGMDHIRESGYVNQLSQILLPVSMGLGFTVIPHSSLDAFPYPALIRSSPLATRVDETVYLVTKKYRALPSRFSLISEILDAQWD